MASYLKKRREKDIDLSSYRDSKFQGNREEYEAKLNESTTLYVGNLSFYTSEEQLYELFGKCGDVKRVIIGLNRESRTPCGFCFVEFHTREDARNAMRYVNGTRLDDRPVRTDWDIGFEKGRQYGRGKSGAQVRDEFRQDFDPGRGGYGGAMRDKMEKLKPAAAAGDEAMSE